MSKQIQVPDHIYQRLKDAADSQYRTIGGHIEYLLSLDEKREVHNYEIAAAEWERQQANLPDVMQDSAYQRRNEIRAVNALVVPLVDKPRVYKGTPEKNTSEADASPTTAASILTEIRRLEKECDEKLIYCQDEETAAELLGEYRSLTADLWDEYNALKGDK